jgi:hypothetical protein
LAPAREVSSAEPLAPIPVASASAREEAWSCDDIRMGYCTGAAAWAAGCGGIVHEAVMTGARPTAKEADTCRTLLGACGRGGHRPNYDEDECERILAASTEGESRRQVEAALGPDSPEPAKCDARYLWPNMPFTPYFGVGGS